jgi:hypothetical protein
MSSARIEKRTNALSLADRTWSDMIQYGYLSFWKSPQSGHSQPHATKVE